MIDLKIGILESLVIVSSTNKQYLWQLEKDLIIDIPT